MYSDKVMEHFMCPSINNITSQIYGTGKTAHDWTDKNFKPLDFLKVQPKIFDILKKSMNVPV